MEKNIVYKIVYNSRYILGFILFIIPYNYIRELPTSYTVLTENALSKIREGTISILIALFLLEPLFKKVSKNKNINTLRFFIGFIFVLYNSLHLVMIVNWGFEIITYGGGTVTSNLNLLELYLTHVDFAALSTFYTVTIIVGILLIKPCLTVNNGKLKFVNFECPRAKTSNIVLLKVDSLFDMIAIYSDEKFNQFLK